MSASALIQTTHVLLVEDDTRFSDAFTLALADLPEFALLGVAPTLKDAVGFLSGPPAQVALVDLGLPDGSGLDFITHLRRHWPDCQAVVATVFGDEKHVLSAIEAGAVGYLLKDGSPRAFVDQLRTLQSGGSPISPLIARHLLRRLQPPPPIAITDTGPVLSEREHEVLVAITKGFSFDEIARLMGVSRHTVLTYGRRIYAKLEVHSKTEAVYEARRLGLVHA